MRGFIKAALFLLILGALNVGVLQYRAWQGQQEQQEQLSRLEKAASLELEREAKPPDPPPELISLLFAGDLMAHNVNFLMDDYDDIYRELAPVVLSADLAFINLETPVVDASSYQTYPRFNVKTPYVEAAVRGGFSVFALANNHTTDQGPAGVLATADSMEALKKREGIVYSGVRRHGRAPFRAESITRGPWRVGFISITSFINVWTGNELVYFVDYHRNAALRREFLDFVASIEGFYDLFVVGIHDGVEYDHQPLERKEIFFREVAEAGADVVWGHHSHVLQPWELWESPGGRKSLLMFSMGNFISGQTWNIDPEEFENPRNATGDSAMLQVDFVKDHTSGEIALHRVYPHSAFHYRDPKKGMVVRSYDSLLGDPDLPEVWRLFYEDRMERLSWFFLPEGEREAEKSSPALYYSRE